MVKRKSTGEVWYLVYWLSWWNGLELFGGGDSCPHLTPPRVKLTSFGVQPCKYHPFGGGGVCDETKIKGVTLPRKSKSGKKNIKRLLCMCVCVCARVSVLCLCLSLRHASLDRSPPNLLSTRFRAPLKLLVGSTSTHLTPSTVSADQVWGRSVLTQTDRRTDGQTNGHTALSRYVIDFHTFGIYIPQSPAISISWVQFQLTSMQSNSKKWISFHFALFRNPQAFFSKAISLWS